MGTILKGGFCLESSVFADKMLLDFWNLELPILLRIFFPPSLLLVRFRYAKDYVFGYITSTTSSPMCLLYESVFD